MKSIIIDTSSERSVVLITKNETILQKKSLPSGYQSSKFLIKELNVDFQGVDSIGVVQGPGLLTGIRVGIATAQGLSLGLGVPLIGLCALNNFLLEGVDAAVIDAKVRGAYVLLREGEPFFCPFGELGAALGGCSKIAGPNLSRIDFPDKVECDPDGDRMAHFMYQKFIRQEFGLRPNYLN